MGKICEVNVAIEFRERYSSITGMNAGAIWSLYTNGVLTEARMRQWLILQDIPALQKTEKTLEDVYTIISLRYGVSESWARNQFKYHKIKLHKINKDRIDIGK